MEQILGVDFSGARDAGQKIWLSVCIERDGALHVKSSVPAGTQFDADSRQTCLRGVRAAIKRADVVGLDVPFGLPAPVHDRESWAGVATMIAERADPQALQSGCVERAVEVTDGQQQYLRRETDRDRGALSPYHWIHAAQTYYGISEVLQPLVVDDAIAIKPIQEGPGTPVCETHPAATLRDIGLPTRGYKDSTDRSRTRRQTIVEGLQMTPLAMHGIEDYLLDDVGGDAIDSLLAALAAWRARRNEFAPAGEFDPVEGHIYV